MTDKPFHITFLCYEGKRSWHAAVLINRFAAEENLPFKASGGGVVWRDEDRYARCEEALKAGDLILPVTDLVRDKLIGTHADAYHEVTSRGTPIQTWEVFLNEPYLDVDPKNVEALSPKLWDAIKRYKHQLENPSSKNLAYQVGSWVKTVVSAIFPWR